jgi:hypothetical protein
VTVEAIAGNGPEVPSDSGFAGGSGTEDDPYQIGTPEQLALLHRDLEAYYVLIADIDLKDYLSKDGKGYNDGKGWEPIGSEDRPFTGFFDGNGCVISNVYICRSDENFVGLFGCVGDEGGLLNVRLEDANITGRDAVGGLVGINYGWVEDCLATTVTIKGNQAVGGLVGINDGLVGVCCATEVNISAGQSVGGLVGDNDFAVWESFAKGKATGGYNVGGLIGNSYWLVWDCYADVAVTGQEVVGG